MTDRLPDGRFQELARIVEAHTGIQMPSSKRIMLEGRLRNRVRKPSPAFAGFRIRFADVSPALRYLSSDFV